MIPCDCLYKQRYWSMNRMWQLALYNRDSQMLWADRRMLEYTILKENGWEAPVDEDLELP